MKNIGFWKEAENQNDPRRNRTFNLLIKSQLLCQLSYGAIKKKNYHKFARLSTGGLAYIMWPNARTKPSYRERTAQ